MEEEWKDIVGYEGLYQVSNLGNVRSCHRYYPNGGVRKGRILMQETDKDGYKRVGLLKNKVHKHRAVHRLVALAFVDNPHNLPQINHKDEDKANNNASNLEWCDCRYNINYGSRNRKMAERIRGENHCYHKLTEKIVKYVREVYVPKDEVYGQKALAKMFNVRPGVISKVINRVNWKHV